MPFEFLLELHWTYGSLLMVYPFWQFKLCWCMSILKPSYHLVSSIYLNFHYRCLLWLDLLWSTFWSYCELDCFPNFFIIMFTQQRFPFLSYPFFISLVLLFLLELQILYLLNKSREIGHSSHFWFLSDLFPRSPAENRNYKALKMASSRVSRMIF